MKRYIKSNSDFPRYYHTYVDGTDRGYSLKVSGSVSDNNLQIQVGRAASNGRRAYAYGHVGYIKPNFIQVYYQGKVEAEEQFRKFDPSTETEDEYLDELAYEAVLLVDEVNERFE